MIQNNNCGSCIYWLAFGEENGISTEEELNKYCIEAKCLYYKTKKEQENKPC